MSAVLERIHAPGPHAALAAAGSLEVALARSQLEVEQAMRLRYRVFGKEMGARIPSRDGLDRDLFDPHCDHLIVRDIGTREVVGTYRVLLPERAKRIGELYADREFWLNRLDPIRDEIVELGRSCVHPDYRSGAVIMLLWSALGEYLSRHDCRYLVGCVSVPMGDGGTYAANLYRQLEHDHLAAEPFRVWPRDRLRVEEFGASGPVQVPGLMKGYLRAGARLLGEPHRDPEFGCADFPMILALDGLDRRYRRRFLQQ